MKKDATHTETIEVAEYLAVLHWSLHGISAGKVRDTQGRVWFLPDPSGGSIISRYNYQPGMRVLIVGRTPTRDGFIAHTASVSTMAAA